MEFQECTEIPGFMVSLPMKFVVLCFVHPIVLSSFGFWYFGHFGCVIFFPVFSFFLLPCFILVFKHLDLGCNFWPCSAGNFIIFHLSSVSKMNQFVKPISISVLIIVTISECYKKLKQDGFCISKL